MFKPQLLHAFTGVPGGFLAGDGQADVFWSADGAGDVGDQFDVDRIAAGMGNGFALRHLGQLADHGADDDVADAAAVGRIEGRREKVAHLHETAIRRVPAIAAWRIFRCARRW